MKTVSILLMLTLIVFIACSKKESQVKPIEDSGSENLLIKANQLYSDGQLDQALNAYQMIYNRYPLSREYIDAVIGLSRCHNAKGEYERGMELLLNLLRENIIPSKVPLIYNEMAAYYEVTAEISTAAGITSEEKDFEKAISYYKKSVAYPNSDDAAAKSYAQFRIAELNISMSKFKEAASAYNSTVKNYPGTEWSDLAQQRLSEMRQGLESGAVTPPPAEKQAQPEQSDDSSLKPDVFVPEVKAPADTAGNP